MDNYNTDGMGGAFAIIVIVFIGIWAMLKDSDRKIKNNAQQEQANKQNAAKAAFTREFGQNNQFDSTDLYLGERLTDYAQAATGGDKFETVKNIAGMIGGFKSVIARESSQATAKLIKDQIEQNRQNRAIDQTGQNPIQAQPVYLHPQHPKKPIVIEQPRRRRVYYDPPYDDEYEYVPRRRRAYNHYEM